MAKLKMVEHRNLGMFHKSMHRLRCLRTDHLCVSGMQIDLDDILHIRVLTCKHGVIFPDHVMSNNDNTCAVANGKGGRRGNIETLRLLHLREGSRFDILNNVNVIQSLNLHRSCKNLFVDIDITHATLNDKLYKVIESTLKKEYYYSLENVNLLLALTQRQIDWVFALLKRNVKILKHQFKQLRIGINVIGINTCMYQIIEWNSKVDEKFLNQCKSLFDDDQLHSLKCQDQQEYEKNKYDMLLGQWL